MAKTDLFILHNPRCGKSRDALRLLTDRRLRRSK